MLQLMLFAWTIVLKVGKCLVSSATTTAVPPFCWLFTLHTKYGICFLLGVVQIWTLDVTSCTYLKRSRIKTSHYKYFSATIGFELLHLFNALHMSRIVISDSLSGRTCTYFTAMDTPLSKTPVHNFVLLFQEAVLNHSRSLDSSLPMQ